MIGKFPPKRADGKTSFGDLREYITDAKKTNGDVWAINLGEDMTEWETEMEDVAALAPRVHDPAVHIVVSWPDGERPTVAQAREACEMTCRELGFDLRPGGHQIIGAVHHDTGHTHIHIEANRVDPRSGEPLHIEWSDRTIAVAMRRIEHRQGWSEDRGIMQLARLPDGTVATTRDGEPIIVPSDYRNPGAVKGKADKMEAATGDVSFVRYAKEQAVPHIRDATRTGDWQEVHRAAAAYGVEVRPQGGGYIVACTSGVAVHARASEVNLKGRDWQRLPEYQPPTPGAEMPAPRRSYAPQMEGGYLDHEAAAQAAKRAEKDAAHARNRARYTDEGGAANAIAKLQRRAERMAMDADWRRERQAITERTRREYADERRTMQARHARERAEAVADERRRRETQLSAWRESSDRPGYGLLRAALAVTRAQRMAEIRERQQRERDALAQRAQAAADALPSWRRRIRDAAADPAHPHHGAAARALRGAQYREGAEAGAEARMKAVISGEAAKPVESLADDLRRLQVRRDARRGGTLYLDIETGNALGWDQGNRIEIIDTSDRALRQMIAVAGARFGGRIELHGSDDFQARAAAEAARQGIRVSNPELAHTWEAARRAHQQAQAPAKPAQAQPVPQAAGEGSGQPPVSPPSQSPPSPPVEGAQEIPMDKQAMREALADAKRDVDLATYAQRAHGWQIADERGRRVELRRGDEALVVDRRGKRDVWYDPATGRSGDLVDLRRRETGEDHATAARALVEYARTAPPLPLPREMLARMEADERAQDAVATRQRAATAEPADLSERAIERQMRAMGCEQFEVGVRHEGQGRGMMNREWTPEQVREGLAWLRSQNAQGGHIYIRPHPETRSGIVLVDDLQAPAIERMRADGYAPAAVVETSPGNYQAWVRLPDLDAPRTDPRQREILTDCGRMLAQEYGGDPASTDWRHFGRLAGYTNQKEKYADAQGRHPYVKIHEWSGQQAPQGAALLAEAGRMADQREQDAAVLARVYRVEGMTFGALPGATAPDPRATAEYRRIVAGLERQYGAATDYSRCDWTAARELARQGWPGETVASAMAEASPNLANRKGAHADDYIRRTVGRAQAAAALEEGGAPPEVAATLSVTVARMQESRGVRDQAEARREARAQAEAARDQAREARERQSEAPGPGQGPEMEQGPGMGR